MSLSWLRQLTAVLAVCILLVSMNVAYGVPKRNRGNFAGPTSTDHSVPKTRDQRLSFIQRTWWRKPQSEHDLTHMRSDTWREVQYGVPIRNLWPSGQPYSIAVYISRQPSPLRGFPTSQTFVNESVLEVSNTCTSVSPTLLWRAEGLTYDFNETNLRTLELNVSLPDFAKQNKTVFLHVCVVKDGFTLDAGQEDYDPLAAYCVPFMWTRYMPARKQPKTVSLLGGGDSIDGNTETEVVDTKEYHKPTPPSIVSYWNPELTLYMIHDNFTFQLGHTPLNRYAMRMLLEPYHQGYLPTVIASRFWTLKKNYIQLNDTVTTVPLKIWFNSYPRWKIEYQDSWDQAVETHENMGTLSDTDMDDVKALVVETNPWILGITLVVSLVHTLFDVLAFKNDVQFWRGRTNFEGLSLGTVSWSCFSQTVVFVYLCQNDTSFLVLVSMVFTLVIEYWKLSKVIKPTVAWRGWIPVGLTLSDPESYVKTSTKQFDSVAITHLKYVLYPLAFGFAVYSLLYDKHKSWFAWLISSLSGFVYAFGFIMMTPQLFINYKLKSVAHLPWRGMIYKALNTFMDDIFAFIITMPLMHRIACFRDDVIFFIYLYQRWIYAVDTSRLNEFGGKGDDEKPSGAKEVSKKDR